MQGAVGQLVPIETVALSGLPLSPWTRRTRCCGQPARQPGAPPQFHGSPPSAGTNNRTGVRRAPLASARAAAVHADTSPSPFVPPAIDRVDTAPAVVARRLAPLFFASGTAALIYQLGWQRLLFTAVGVDIESITIVVSVFMLGLGLGALLGGQLADRHPQRALIFFAAAECAIGLFGWFSPELLRACAQMLVMAPRAVVAVANFGLLLLPTCLMGATLPILVAHLTRLYGNVGQSIGLLYQANTLGAAVGVALFGFLWFLLFDLDTAIRFAAVLNLAIAATTALWARRAHG